MKIGTLFLRGTVSIAVASTSLLLATPVLAANKGTSHFGPYVLHTTDYGSCNQGKQAWATDQVNVSYIVHNNGDGTFKVRVAFKNGTFTTVGDPSVGEQSPSACATTSGHGTKVRAGVVGTFHGFLAGTVTTAVYNRKGCDPKTGADCSTPAGFLTAVFGVPGAASFTCNPGIAGCVSALNYQSGNQLLIYRHWQVKADKLGGRQFTGDIANS
jgi:hypothetical protein